MKKTMLRLTEEDCRNKYVPLSGNFELTPRCTLDCKMCYVHLTNEQMNGRKELPTEEWLRIIDEAHAAGMMFTIITGGECMLHPGFKEIYLRMKQYGMIIIVNTNATLIDDDYISFFKQNPPAKMQITLYGNTEDGYERVTGRRCCQLVKDNILKLKAAGVNVKISVTVSRYLYDEALDIVKFAREHKIPYLVDPDMIAAEEGTQRLKDDYCLTTEQIVSLYLEIMKLEGRKPYQNEYMAELPVELIDERATYGLRCAAGRSLFCVKWNGMMQACLSTEDSGISVVGVPFLEAWKKLNEYAQSYKVPIECFKCPLQSVCNGCAIRRSNSSTSGHCDRTLCKTTLAKYNAGIVRPRPIE